MNHDELAATEQRIKQATGLIESDAYCLTVLVDATKADVLEAFGVAATAPLESLDEILDEPEYIPVLMVLPAAGASLAVEPNGYFGHLQEVLAVSSIGRRVASYYSGNDGESVLVLAENGEVLLDEEWPDDVEDLQEEWRPLFAGLEPLPVYRLPDE